MCAWIHSGDTLVKSPPEIGCEMPCQVDMSKAPKPWIEQMLKTWGKLFRIHSPVSSWSEIVYTLSRECRIASSAKDLVLRRCWSASASTFVPPQLRTQSGSADSSILFTRSKAPALRGNESASLPYT